MKMPETIKLPKEQRFSKNISDWKQVYEMLKKEFK